MSIEATTHVLGLVVAVMFLQAFISLASSIQDLWTKLLVGRVLCTWANDRGTIDDTTTPEVGAQTGAYTRVKTRKGRYRNIQLAGEEADFEDEDFKEESEQFPVEEEPERWKSLYRNLQS